MGKGGERKAKKKKRNKRTKIKWYKKKDTSSTQLTKTAF